MEVPCFICPLFDVSMYRALLLCDDGVGGGSIAPMVCVEERIDCANGVWNNGIMHGVRRELHVVEHRKVLKIKKKCNISLKKCKKCCIYDFFLLILYPFLKKYYIRHSKIYQEWHNCYGYF